VNNFKRWLTIGLGSGLVVLLLVGVLAVVPAFAQGPRGGGMRSGGMRGGGMMGGFGPGGMMGYTQGFSETTPFGGYGPGWMMQGGQGFTGTVPFGYGPGSMMGGMMDGFVNGMMSGMMVNSNSPFYQAAAPLSLAEATDILNAYLADLNNSNLELADVMIFDNQAYAQIVEKDSGIGVMEVLVDPATKIVYPEMGPNMMWNLKYGMMSGFGGYGMMGGMMGGRFGFNRPGGAATGIPAEMPISPEKAVELAQSYLQTYFPHLTAAQKADPFYGYYTIHVNQDGQTAGMLSVNGYTGQVFPHTWHGKLLEMSGD
jgi:hypothetical protein